MAVQNFVHLNENKVMFECLQRLVISLTSWHWFKTREKGFKSPEYDKDRLNVTDREVV